MDQTIESKPADGAPLAGSRYPSVDIANVFAQTQQMVSQVTRVPRQHDQIIFQLKVTCSDFEFADSAIYAVSFNGQMQEGLSIRAMEEAARIYGNMDYGYRLVREGEDQYYGKFTDCEAYCWDMYSNNRSTSSFRVWHHIAKKDKLKGSYTYHPITEPSSIDRLIAARASRHIRNCIHRLLPAFVTRKMFSMCNETLEKGKTNEKPLRDRVIDMINAFATLGVTKDMLEGKAKIPSERWELSHFKLFSQIYTGLRDGEAIADYFPEFHPIESPKTSEVRQAISDMRAKS